MKGFVGLTGILDVAVQNVDEIGLLSTRNLGSESVLVSKTKETFSEICI